MIRGHKFIDDRVDEISIGTFIIGDVFVSERELAFCSSTETIARLNISGFAS